MKRSILFSGFAIILLFIQGCDKVKFPNETATGPTGPTGPTVVVRKAFVEDYTGHTCGNCPPAAECLERLQNQYGSSMVELTVHAGFLAYPSSSPFLYDFRTTAGTNYHNAWGVASYPTEVLNRKNWPLVGMLMDTNSLKARIDSIINSAPSASITITPVYNTISRNLDVTVKSKFLAPLSGYYNLVLLFVEDSIQKPQKDDRILPNGIDNNYYHHHVLRACINGTSGWGDTLFYGSVNTGDSITKTFTNFSVPQYYNNGSSWTVDDRKCYVVAYIYDAETLSSTHYEVIQVEEKKIR